MKLKKLPGTGLVIGLNPTRLVRETMRRDLKSVVVSKSHERLK